jgi:hypothetical protein
MKNLLEIALTVGMLLLTQQSSAFKLLSTGMSMRSNVLWAVPKTKASAFPTETPAQLMVTIAVPIASKVFFRGFVS